MPNYGFDVNFTNARVNPDRGIENADWPKMTYDVLLPLPGTPEHTERNQGRERLPLVPVERWFGQSGDG